MTDASTSYTPAPITTCPPLTSLQASGLCCPFVLTANEQDASAALQNLRHYPIVWYRPLRLREMARGLSKDAVRTADRIGVNRTASSNVVKTAGTFFDGMLGTVDRLLGSSAEADVPCALVGVKAELSVVDTQEFGPALLVQQVKDDDESSTCDAQDTTQQPTSATTMSQGKQSELPSKLIQLHKISTVSPSYSLFNDPTAGGIKLFGRPTSFLSSGEELLRFDTLGGEGGIAETLFPAQTKRQPNEYADTVIEQIKSLVEWNRRRVARDVKKGRVGIIESTNDGSVVLESL